jgi:quinol monooxygenase YgiN
MPVMELHVFIRFHVREGAEKSAEEALGEVVPLSRAEAGCVQIHAYRSKNDARLFYIHSIWKDDAAFDIHAKMPHTVRFLEKMSALTDQPRELTRTQMIG